MIGQVTLSESSQGLLKEYLAYDDKVSQVFGDEPVNLATSDLLDLLNKNFVMKFEDKKRDFILTSLRLSLLKDLCHALPGGSETELDKKSTLNDKMQFIFLGVVGTLVAACQGFDSMCTLMALFPVSTMAVLFVSLAFAVLSVILFYAVDLAQVAIDKGVHLQEAPLLLDLQALELQEIKKLTQKLRDCSLAPLSYTELKELSAITCMMQFRLEELTSAATYFDTARQESYVKVAQGIFAAIYGLLYFGGGFFAGQTVGFFALSLFTAVPMLWPPIIFSALVGLAAFGIYWCMQKETFDRVITRLFGLDEDKIDALCNIPNQEAKELKVLNKQITDSLILKSQTIERQHRSRMGFFDEQSRTSQQDPFTLPVCGAVG